MTRPSNAPEPSEQVGGDSAAERFAQVSGGARTVEVTCRYTGGHSVRAVWGQAGSDPFVYLHDTGRPDSFAADADAERVYQALLSELVRRQSFVDSDPRSPDYFTPDRDLYDVADEVNGLFGTSVDATVF